MKALTTLVICFIARFTCTTAADTISVTQTIRDGQTIVSPQQVFELGFFSPSNTTQNRYLGIWYKEPATGPVIWVANRDTPIPNKSGEVTLNPGGLLVLRDSATNRTIWSSNLSRNTGNIVAQLLDNSNFIVFDSQSGPENYIWQSFDEPTDTLMPDMKFGRNLKRDLVTNYTSWKSDDDPSRGEYMIFMDFNGLPQIFQKKGDDIQYRLGSWNGLQYSGSTNNQPNPIYKNWFYINENEIAAVYVLLNPSALTRLTVSPDGNMEQWYWVNQSRGWFVYAPLIKDSCERYALCGVYGSCDVSQSPNCGCLRGFTPKRPDHWDMADWSSGCEREIALDCGVGEGFRKYSFMKLPDTRESWFDRNMSVEECRVKCTNECNCTAYATLDIKLDSGCLLWYDELIDMRTLPDNGPDIYIRMSAIELEKDKNRQGRKGKVGAVVIIPLSLGLIIFSGLFVLIIMKMKKKKNVGKTQGMLDQVVETEDIDLPFFSLSTLKIATNNFSVDNKLGEGGFGPVYKGCMDDGQEIAVKRLSLNSNQGVEEFKNEIIFISKLQHRNLVKILGCCIEGEEKLLIYEYMPNNSLDLFLFGETKNKIFDWTQRFYIINGIARGLLYLHQDSQLLIIHRDLKAANVLLDQYMNPRISDFGLARSFGGNENGTITNRVVGTYGYMSPEYASDGIFSVKSDVFSFGVLVLEIVSGRKSRGFYDETTYHNLVGHAWTLYKNGETDKLVDPSLNESGCTSEMLLTIHVGLLCVQRDPKCRPNMSKVVTMLSGQSDKLPDPEQPGFYTEENSKFRMQTQSSSNATTLSRSTY
ncbi:G-type lectin S-receptor-like serine/threonine-protein kinase At4g27290 [Rutidosis leptorrhynchoides]|uniref:G-type lectin S-receptor-like serine/threonine-protein kinase At4g27290 n=1 Tax=Rutidosis leptorrhynchoides TaxID=125765 RepID=UPI003A994230